MKKTSISIFFFFLVLSSIVVSESVKEIEVDETELVNIKVDAQDADEDNLTIDYPSPLNSTGQWQTTYGDYGKYPLNITVSDGSAKTTKSVLLIVNKVNWPPIIEPIDNVVIKETETVEISPVIEDEDIEDLTISVSDPVGDDMEWKTGYEDAGEYSVTITATDGQHTTSYDFKLTVENLNREPSIEDSDPEEKEISIDETEEVEFSVSAEDPDKDKLSYIWLLDEEEVSSDEDYTYKADYDSAGSHEVEVKVSDGDYIISESWNLEVENVNRAPSIEHIRDISVKEGETVKLDLKAEDPDGDELKYSIAEPIGNDKIWETGYDDAGVYPINVMVTDGKLVDETEVLITVLDVDRAPVFEEVESINIKEEENVNIKLKATDPDGDMVTFTAESLPENAQITGNIISFSTDYETIQKPDNKLNSILQKIRLDSIVYRDIKNFYIDVTAAGKEKSSSQTIKITVENVNRPPRLLELEDITIKEGDTIRINPKVIEYDNDRVAFYISEPVGNNGEWKTGYDSAGTYVINVSASDGELEDSTSFTLTVKNVNRPPEFKNIKPGETDEGETVTITPEVSDPDGEDIEVSVEQKPDNSTFTNDSLSWKPSYDAVLKEEEQKDYDVVFIADDGTNTSGYKATIIVNDVNRAPVIEKAEQSKEKIYTGQSVLFTIEASDPDEDNLTYTWKTGLFEKIEDSKPKLKRYFVTPGTKKVKAVISDGTDYIEKEFSVIVSERPRPARKAESGEMVVYYIPHDR
ncbi:hypothetical protein GF336_04320 [Candidatus Woesearchaeota archaeon]|nr:hypothetical protein [Candidatus Woesearchaeota archaeon]